MGIYKPFAQMLFPTPLRLLCFVLTWFIRDYMSIHESLEEVAGAVEFLL